MFIETDELADIVAVASHGAVPAVKAETIVRSLRHNSVRADTSSPLSTWLREMLLLSTREIGDVTHRRLAGVELYGVNLPIINAIPRLERGRPQIIIFEGLLQLVRYFADLITVLACLQATRPNAVIARPEGEEPEYLALSTAGFSVLADFMQGGMPPAAIGDLLGPRARGDVLQGFRKATVFTILHEFAHLELGHLADFGVRSELQHLSLLEPEALSAHQREELEADAYALESMPVEYRGEFADGVVFLLGGYAFQEVFTGRLSDTHPLAFNRLHVLTQAMNLPKPYHEIISSWIGDRLHNWRSFAGERDTEGENFARRIHRTMPVRQAYREIALIRGRVEAEGGHLDRGV